MARSKFATDLMWRLWDSVREEWVSHNNRSIWALQSTPAKHRDRLIEEGRNPDTLTVERVFVEVK